MNEQDAPQSASAEEEARIGETPADFANKVHVSPMLVGAKITFAEARRTSGADHAAPKGGDNPAERRSRRPAAPLDWTTGAADTLPEGFGGA